jgi:hypothetical protein
VCAQGFTGPDGGDCVLLAVFEISLVLPLSLLEFDSSVHYLFIDAVAAAADVDSSKVNIARLQEWSLRRLHSRLLLADAVQIDVQVYGAGEVSLEAINAQLQARGLPAATIAGDSACPPGSQRSTVQSNSTIVSCSPCAQGTYKPTLGREDCSACPAGTSTSGGARELSDCKSCPAGSFAHRSPAASSYASADGKQQICKACSRNHVSSAGSQGASACRCAPGFQGSKCLIPILSNDLRARRFLVELDIFVTIERPEEQLNTDSSFSSSSSPELAGKMTNALDLPSHLAAYFSTPVTLVDVRSAELTAAEARRRSSRLEVAASVAVVDDFDSALAQVHLRQSLLEAFLSSETGMPSVVSNLELTCGEGHVWNADQGTCAPCEAHTYKQALDNSTCLPCPANSFTGNSTAARKAYSIDACRCATGYRPSAKASRWLATETQLEGNASASSPNSTWPSHQNSTYWRGALVCDRADKIDQETLDFTRTAVTSAVVSVLAVQVGVSVATSVASSVTASIATSAGQGVGTSAVGGGVGSSAVTGESHSLSSSGITLITQVLSFCVFVFKTRKVSPSSSRRLLVSTHKARLGGPGS